MPQAHLLRRTWPHATTDHLGLVAKSLAVATPGGRELDCLFLAAAGSLRCSPAAEEVRRCQRSGIDLF